MRYEVYERLYRQYPHVINSSDHLTINELMEFTENEGCRAFHWWYALSPTPAPVFNWVAFIFDTEEDLIKFTLKWS